MAWVYTVDIVAISLQWCGDTVEAALEMGVPSQVPEAL
jgi:hypothetical protein